MGNQLEDILITPLSQIEHVNGNIFHALKASETSFKGFGEAYFSFIKEGNIKGWKKHPVMTLNLIVPLGKIRFVIYDGLTNLNNFREVILGPTHNYSRLTVPPGYWVAFQGMESQNCLLNVASIEHDPKEAINMPLDEFDYSW